MSKTVIDLSNYSYEELNELEKEIRKKKKEGFKTGKIVTKRSISYEHWERLHMLLEERFPVEKYGGTKYESDEICSGFSTAYCFKTEKSIFALCDLALKNYHDAPDKSPSHVSENHIPPKGQYLKPILGNGPDGVIKTDPEKYEHMYNEIFNIFMKYAEGETR